MDKQEYTQEDSQWNDRKEERRSAEKLRRWEERRGRRGSHKVGKGLIFIFIGFFLFLRSLDLLVPDWVFSWQLLLITIGCVVWIASEFKNWGGLVMLLIGAIFFAKEYLLLTYDVTRFIWPAIFTIVGLALIFGKRQESSFKSKRVLMPGTSKEDYIDSTVIFGGENRVVVSKDFRGGKVAAIFGGSDFNLLQSDFNGRIELDVTCMFGGVELTIPANWTVMLDISPIMGGVSDSRPLELLSNTNPDKVLVIRGTCLFGGVEIRNHAEKYI